MKKSDKIRRYLASNPNAPAKEVAEKFDAAVSQVYKIKKEPAHPLMDTPDPQMPKFQVKRRGRPHKLAVKMETMRMQLAQTSNTSIADAQPDMVNHPPHYKDGGIEAKRLGYHLGNVIKYICRAGKKGTNMGMQDLQKARWYLDRAIEKNEVHTPTR